MTDNDPNGVVDSGGEVLPLTPLPDSTRAEALREAIRRLMRCKEVTDDPLAYGPGVAVAVANLRCMLGQDPFIQALTKDG